jgi:chromosomal replication initiation ATPase DnaA
MTSPITPSAWEIVKHEIKAHVSREAFELWIKPLVFLSSTARSITLGTSNDLVAIWVHDTYLRLIEARLTAFVGDDVSVVLAKAPFRR